MFKRLNGWMRIGVLVSTFWLIGWLATSVVVYREFLKTKWSLVTIASDMKKKELDLREINPDWYPADRSPSTLGGPGLYNRPWDYDSYTDREYHRVWAMISQQERDFANKLYVNSMRFGTGVPLQFFLTQPSSVSTYISLDTEFWKLHERKILEASRLAVLKDSWQKRMILAFIGPLLFLGLVQLVLFLVRWVKEGFAPANSRH